MRRLHSGVTALAVLLTAGCAAAGDPSTGATSSIPLTGRSTAVVTDESVTPVADDPTPALPVTVRSFDGDDVTVTDVTRIIAVDLHGTLAEIVFGLGLGEHVVGRDSSTGFPEAASLPEVTVGGHALNAEAILDLDPTVVLSDDSIGPSEVHGQLRDAGIPVVLFDPTRDLGGVDDQIRAVAAALGVDEAGEKLVDRVDSEITAARASLPADQQPVRIAFLYMRGTAVSLMAGPGSGADAMIEAIGAVNVGTDIGLQQEFVPLTSEALITAAPDVILMMTGGLESIRGVDGLLKVPGVAQTPAGQNRRVVDMEDTLLLSFGPRSGATIEALARAVYAP